MAVQKKKSGIRKKTPAAKKVVTKKAAATRTTKGAATPKKTAAAKQPVTAKKAAKTVAGAKSARVKPAPKTTPKKAVAKKTTTKKRSSEKTQSPKTATKQKGTKKTVKSTSELLKAIKERDIATGSGSVPETVAVTKPPRKKVAVKKPMPIIPPMQKPVEIVPTSAKTKPAKICAQFSKTELNKFRKELLRMRDHFAGQTHAMKHDALQRDDEVNPEEDGTDAFMRLQVLSQMDDQQHIIAEIDEALDCIDKGNYGICQMCDCLIGKQRLAVRPFSKFCVTCKTELETSGRHKKKR